MTPALNKGQSGRKVIDGLLRVVASHLDVTGPSIIFKKPYGFGVIDGISFATYFREYVLLVSSVTGPDRQTRPAVTMIVEPVRLSVNNQFSVLMFFFSQGIRQARNACIRQWRICERSSEPISTTKRRQLTVKKLLSAGRSSGRSSSANRTPPQPNHNRSRKTSQVWPRKPARQPLVLTVDQQLTFRDNYAHRSLSNNDRDLILGVSTYYQIPDIPPWTHILGLPGRQQAFGIICSMSQLWALRP